MPRNSIDGSAFPLLEQEGRSAAHPRHTPQKKQIEARTTKKSENKRKTEKSNAINR